MENQSTSLYFRSGSSDKEYHIYLKSVGEDGWNVEVNYGRCGSALRSGLKTNSPVEYDSAKKIYDKAVKEKKNKGYTEDISGALYQSPEKKDIFTGIVPQLLNPIQDSALEDVLRDNGFVMQEKFDGERRIIEKTCKDGVISVKGINRKGLSVPLPLKLVEAVKSLPIESFLMDGEIIGENFIAFDLLAFAGVSIKDKPFIKRYEHLLNIFEKNKDKNIAYAKVAKTETEKRKIFEKVKSENGEGVVFKVRNSLYAPGRPSSGGDHRKFKFTESATVFVTKISESKRSVYTAAKNESGEDIPLGKVSIPQNHDVPKVGDLVEVSYLYAYPGGALFQPVYKGVRNDIDVSACVTSKLKYKQQPQSYKNPQTSKKIK